jgi:hypothetical protein
MEVEFILVHTINLLWKIRYYKIVPHFIKQGQSLPLVKILFKLSILNLMEIRSF